MFKFFFFGLPYEERTDAQSVVIFNEGGLGIKRGSRTPSLRNDNG